MKNLLKQLYNWSQHICPCLRQLMKHVPCRTYGFLLLKSAMQVNVYHELMALMFPRKDSSKSKVIEQV